MSRAYKAPIIKKTFQILKQIARHPDGMSISDLARHLSFSKGTVHGITAALAELGVVQRDDPTKRYRLGATLFELGRTAYDRIDVKDIARPYIEGLMRQTEESVYLGITNLDRVVIVDIVESEKDLKITSPIGTTIPLVAGATGKVFLAQWSNDTVIEMLRAQGITRFTQNTITDAEQMLCEIKAARINGYAVDDEEYISGVRAVAAPIQNGGRSPAAIWVVGFKPSLDDLKMPSVIDAVKAAAADISFQLIRNGRA